MPTITIIFKGKKRPTPFLHLPHGSDARLHMEYLPDVVGSKMFELFHTSKEPVKDQTQFSVTMTKESARKVFLSALRYIRREAEGAKFRDETDPERNSRHD